MAKKPPYQKSKPKEQVSSVPPKDETVPPLRVRGRQLPGWSYFLLIFLFSCALYSNTLWNRYAIDDTIVLTDNRFTKKGLAGIKDHFTHDMFEGFFGERGARLVSGGRYRPLSMVSLTVEYEISRKWKGDKRGIITDKTVIMGDSDPYLSPMLNHSVNIILFGLTCMVLYYLLLQIIPRKFSIRTPVGDIGIPFIAALLYAAHPLHTEAVANVKGRDEVMCMLFSLLALLAAVKYVKTQRVFHLVWGGLIYFVALMSKENAITFFAVAPLTFFFFTKEKLPDKNWILLFSFTIPLIYYLIWIKYSWMWANEPLSVEEIATRTKIVICLFVLPLLIHHAINYKSKYIHVSIIYGCSVVFFLFLRSKYTQAGLTQDSPEILNNPFVYAVGSQRYATAILTWLYYFKLLVFPHPLTHDYYYNQIPYVDFGDWKFLLSFIVNAGLLIYALINLRKKTIPSFAILFYFITFSIASNLLFTVGVLMNERFIYMSSLGFCILLAYIIVRAKDWVKVSPMAVSSVLLVILMLYSYATFSRNFDWKDSFYLFRRDVSKSPNSAKIQTSVGGDLTKAADRDISELRRTGMITTIFNDLSCGTKTEDELNRINALPDSTIRTLLLDSAISHLQEAIRIYPTHSNAWLLLGNAMYKRDHSPEEVIPVYEKASAYRVGGYYDAYFNLGIVYNEMKSPNHDVMIADAMKAKDDLLKANAIKPEVVECRFLLAQVFAKLNQPDSVEYWLKDAARDRDVAGSDYYYIGTNFGKVAGNLPLAIKYLNKAIETNPKAELYYEDLGVAYGLNGQYDEAIATSEKLLQLDSKYPAAYMNLSVSYRNKGNVKLADEYLQKYNEVTSAKK